MPLATAGKVAGTTIEWSSLQWLSATYPRLQNTLAFPGRPMLCCSEPALAGHFEWGEHHGLDSSCFRRSLALLRN